MRAGSVLAGCGRMAARQKACSSFQRTGFESFESRDWINALSCLTGRFVQQSATKSDLRRQSGQRYGCRRRGQFSKVLVAMLGDIAAASQKTLKTAIGCRGIGLHSGQKVSMTLHPAVPNRG